MRTALFRRLRHLIRQADREQSFHGDRRRVLKGMAISGALATPLGSSFAALAQVGANRNLHPVAVLGGGIAGLTAAYELSKHGIPCTVYEASARLGGRMMTYPNFNSDNMTVELGGEFVDTNHADLIRLCGELNIGLDAYSVEDKNLEPNLYYFGKQYYTDKDAIEALKPFLKKLRQDLAGLKSPKIRDQFDRQSLEEYFLSLHQVADSWLLQMLRVAYIGESGLDVDELPALYILWCLDPDTSHGFKMYGDSDQVMCIRGGNQTLITALQSKLQKRGVEICTSHQLVKVSDHGRKLTFAFDKDGTSKTVTADKAICTLPFSTLRLVQGVDRLDLNPRKKDVIENLPYGTCSKLILGYKSRLWRTGGLKTADGRTIPRSNGMVYTDLRVQNIWEMSRTQKGAAGILTNYVGGREGRELNSQLKDEYLRANDQIFPGLLEHQDGHMISWNWHDYVFAKGSYHSAKVGQVARFGRIACEPELAGRLHFAGEHAAEKFGGFMNGACLSGRRAARQIFPES